MSDRAIPSSLANMLSELATFGSRHRDTSLVAKIANQFDDVDGPNPSTKFVSQMEHPNQSVMGYAKASVPDISGLLSANAEAAQYALSKFQKGLKEYLTTEEHGTKDAVGGFGVVRPRTFGAFAAPFQDVKGVKGGITTLVNHNGGTFGTVGAGGMVKKPTTSIRPRPTTTASLSHNPSWGIVGEEGDMKPPSTTTKPKAGHRSAIYGLRNGIGVLHRLSGHDSQIK